MFIGEFTRRCHTTKDTIRFYVDSRLLTPAKHGRNYWYTDAEVDDFDQIRELLGLGFSIAAIQQIKAHHDAGCGTKAQWQFNADLIASELAQIAQQQAELTRRAVQLNQYAGQLQTLLAKK